MQAKDIRYYNREAVHPSITAEQISTLVEVFYQRIHDDERLDKLFSSRLDGRWPAHLDKMKSFWRSVLLKSGEYKGRPVPVHQQIEDIQTQDFKIWIKLFSQTVDEIFEIDARPLIVTAAKRIATSLWLSRTNNPFLTPPQWDAKTIKIGN